MDDIIVVQNLVKDYGNQKGVFNLNFRIKKGEVVGFVGVNGAGKTTTIRNIMGFIKPDEGKILVKGLDSYFDSDKIKNYIGYVPGEIAFPDFKTGKEFLLFQSKMQGLNDLDYANVLMEKLQLDCTANLKRMSKGMKQKTAIVAALMNNPEILILDEPTTGLDPLMRLSFLEIMEEEKKKGKTIFISSHLYEELERICDRVILIDEGKILDIANMKLIRNRSVQSFKIEFNNKSDYKKFGKMGYEITRIQDKFNQITINVKKNKIQELFNDLSIFDVKFIAEVNYSLEKYFDSMIKEDNYDKQSFI